MSMNKCDICGGLIIINTDTGMGICDSCGGTVEVDKEEVKKYQFILETAERKMMYNSVKYYTEAKEMLEGIPFVDGVKEKITTCDKRISETKKSQESRAKQIQHEDTNSTKTGVIIAVCLIVVLLLIAAAIGFVIFKLIRGELSTEVTCVLGAVIVIAVVLFVVGKIKGN